MQKASEIYSVELRWWPEERNEIDKWCSAETTNEGKKRKERKKEGKK